jgi:hypothetical protein
MKLLFSLFLISGLTSFSFAHNYFFGFAEMQFNASTKTLEATIILSAHDFEDYLIDSKKLNGHLEEKTKDTLFCQQIENEIANTFIVSHQNQKVRFSMLGFEVTKTGFIQIYLVAQNIDFYTDFSVEFTTLMDQYDAQQNKLTYIYNSQKQTAVFLQKQRTANIHL